MWKFLWECNIHKSYDTDYPKRLSVKDNGDTPSIFSVKWNWRLSYPKGLIQKQKKMEFTIYFIGFTVTVKENKIR